MDARAAEARNEAGREPGLRLSNMSGTAKGAEVILDCSHVPREMPQVTRLSKNKAVLACPMCRKAQYQKRAYHRGEAIRRRQAAVRSMHGMSIVRAKYGTLLLNFYQQGRGCRGPGHSLLIECLPRQTISFGPLMQRQMPWTRSLLKWTGA